MLKFAAHNYTNKIQMSPMFEQELNKFVESVTALKNKNWAEFEVPAMEILHVLFEESEEILSAITSKIQEPLNDIAIARMAKAYPDSPYYYHYNEQIDYYCKQLQIEANRFLPRGWFKISFILSKGIKFRIVFCIFFQKNQNKIVILPFFEYLEKIKYQSKRGFKPKDKEHEIESDFVANSVAFDNQPFLITADIDTIRFEVENLKNYYIQKVSLALQKISEIINQLI